MKHPTTRPLAAALLAAGLLVPVSSRADGVSVPAPDAGAAACALANPCGDVNGSASVTSTDALLVLKLAVGQTPTVQCQVTGAGGGGSLLSTGQSKCYSNAGAEVSCTGTGQDGEAAAGSTPSYTDNGNGTITDNVTGLVWEKLDDSNLSGDAGIHDKDREFTFTTAMDKVATFNAFSFGGRSDWRLPNVRELESILNYGKSSPAVSSAFNSSCTSGCKTSACSCTATLTPYWTSTSYDDTKTYAWIISFIDGQTVAMSKGTSLYVRLVAGGA